MLPASTERVPEHTSAHSNEAIAEQTAENIRYFRQHRSQIPRRLRELDQEWDVERALATGSSCLSLIGLAFGFSGRRRWFVLPLAVQTFYLQHTLQGWCPPLPIFRRLGFRTPSEIERERCELEAILDSGDGYAEQ
jgi:hypothetical protein